MPTNPMVLPRVTEPVSYRVDASQNMPVRDNLHRRKVTGGTMTTFDPSIRHMERVIDEGLASLRSYDTRAQIGSVAHLLVVGPTKDGAAFSCLNPPILMTCRPTLPWYALALQY